MRTRLPVQIDLRCVDGRRRWSLPAWHVVAVRPASTAEVSNNSWLTIELHRKDTEGYRTNLSGTRAVYVVLRADSEGVLSKPFLATVCPFEAQDYADDSDSQVDAVPMPDLLMAAKKRGILAVSRVLARIVPFPIVRSYWSSRTVGYRSCAPAGGRISVLCRSEIRA